MCYEGLYQQRENLEAERKEAIAKCEKVFREAVESGRVFVPSPLERFKPQPQLKIEDFYDR